VHVNTSRRIVNGGRGCRLGEQSQQRYKRRSGVGADSVTAQRRCDRVVSRSAHGHTEANVENVEPRVT
jgi:hypothetical protein